MDKKRNNVISIPQLITNLALLEQAKEIVRLQEQHRNTCEMAVRTILHALDCKDHYTFGHSTRVAFHCLVLGRELKLSEKELYDLELACLFHDIGKIGVPDSILLKPTRLTDEEFTVMKSHPEKSAVILQEFQDFEKVALYAKHHHERWDGKGYPYCLQGDDIPFFSRMILISDTFDAMTSSRPYRKGLPAERAFQELKDFSSTQFDPELVKHFISAITKDLDKKEDTFFLRIIHGQFKKEAA
jgi:putative nucleotidyltransferase with HDIG domain